MTSAGFDLRVGGRVWLDGQGWEVAELTGLSVRLLREGRLRTVSIGSLIGCQDAGEPDQAQEGSRDDLWSIPSVVLVGLSSRQRDALTRKLDTLRPLLEPGPEDERTLGSATRTPLESSEPPDARSNARYGAWSSWGRRG